MRTITKMFIMVCVLGLTAVSCSKEDLVDDDRIEINSTEGTDGEVKPEPEE